MLRKINVVWNRTVLKGESNVKYFLSAGGSKTKFSQKTLFNNFCFVVTDEKSVLLKVDGALVIFHEIGADR